MDPIQIQKRTICRNYVRQRVGPLTVVGAIALFSGGITFLASGVARGTTVDITATVSQDQPLVRLALADTAFAGGDRPLLQFGNDGPEVQAVQALLQLMGYYSGQIDGRYQADTVSAVIAFQQAAGLDGDGIVGPTTWAKLLPLPQQIASTNVVMPPTSPESPSATPNAAPTPAPTPTPAPPVESSNVNASPAPSPTPPAEATLPTLRLGMRGPAVVSVQERLRRLGFFQGAVDGVFGSQTEAAVKAAQRSFNLNPDGIVGPVTWTALLQ